MNKLFAPLLTLLIFAANVEAQHTRMIVSVLDTYHTDTKDTWEGKAEGITISLLEKTVNDSMFYAVSIKISTIKKEILGTQTEVVLNSLSGVGVGGGRINQFNKENERLELSKKDMADLIDFLDWSMVERKSVPSNEKIIAINMDNSLTVGVIYQNYEWDYLIQIGSAQFVSNYNQGQNINQKLRDYYSRM